MVMGFGTVFSCVCRFNWLGLSGHVLGNSCSPSLPYVLFASFLFVDLVIFYFGYEDRAGCASSWSMLTFYSFIFGHLFI